MKTFTESNICPHCGGRLINDPIVLTSNPPQYQAHCEKCGKVFHSYHMIGVVDLPEVPDGMWCVDSNSTFVHADTLDGGKLYQVDSDGHYVLISKTKDCENCTSLLEDYKITEPVTK